MPSAGCGIERATIETAAADFNMLGVQMRGYHDFGVALQERNATRGVKMEFGWWREEVRAAA